MKFLEDAEPVTSSDMFYDLFDGGYIKPEKLLEEKDAQEVRAAMGVIQQFFEELEVNDLLEEM